MNVESNRSDWVAVYEPIRRPSVIDYAGRTVCEGFHWIGDPNEAAANARLCAAIAKAKGEA